MNPHPHATTPTFASQVPSLDGQIAKSRRVDVPGALREMFATHVPSLVPALVPAAAVPGILPISVPALVPFVDGGFIEMPGVEEGELPGLAPGILPQLAPGLVPDVMPVPPPVPLPSPVPAPMPAPRPPPPTLVAPVPVAFVPQPVGGGGDVMAAPAPVPVRLRATVRMQFGTRDCADAEAARGGSLAACGGVSGGVGECAVGAVCRGGARQTQSVVDVTVGLPADAAPAFQALVAGGKVEGVPPTAAVSVDGTPVAPPPVVAGGYLRATVRGEAECAGSVAACAARLRAGGFDAGTRTLSCVCGAVRRVVGPVVVTVAPGTGVDAAQFASAVAAAFSACVTVTTPATSAGAGEVTVATACPAAAGKGSKKGLLGLLGLLGLIPLLLCPLVLGACVLRRRRRKAAEVMFACIDGPAAYAPQASLNQQPLQCQPTLSAIVATEMFP